MALVFRRKSSWYSTKFRFITVLLVCVVVGALFTLALPKLGYAQDLAPTKIESEDGRRVSREGTWLSQSANAASGGNYLYNSGAATLSLNFAGPSLEVIYIAGPTRGTALMTVISTNSEAAYQQSAKIDYLTYETHGLKVYSQGGGIIVVVAFVINFVILIFDDLPFRLL